MNRTAYFHKRHATILMLLVNLSLVQMMIPTGIEQNLRHIQERIATAASRVGRKLEDITLIGVSKTHPASAIQEAF